MLGFVLWQNFLQPAPVVNNQNQQVTPDEMEEEPVTPMKVASDTTLGSRFAVKYPADWKNVHSGAKSPQSTQTAQSDKNTITSPSGKLHVVLDVSTGGGLGGGICSNDGIKLKYLATAATPDYKDGRFVAYVVYFPGSNLYQYHVGLQKNTKAIRSVTTKSNTACNFYYSEFFVRKSVLPGVPNSVTTLRIIIDSIHTGFQSLKPGLDESDVIDKLSGQEYQQAKAIIQSVYLK